MQLDVGTLRVWRCVGVGFSRRVDAGNFGVRRGGEEGLISFGVIGGGHRDEEIVIPVSSLVF